MQTFFGKYLKENSPDETEVYELKFTKGISIPFDRVPEHQIEALLKSENEGLYHKITDQPWGRTSNIRYTSKKPFDCLFITKVKAYLVVWFYVPRKPKIFYKIRIKDFLEMEKQTDRKSFTEDMVSKWGIPIHL